MRTPILLVGVALLLIGIVLVGVVIAGALGALTTYGTFVQSGQGEYASSEIAINSSSLVVVASPPAVGGLIPSQDLGVVTSGNLNTYAVPVNKTASNADTYRSVPSGEYYYVVFGSAQPNTKVVVTSLGTGLLKLGALVLGGIALVIVGIIVAIVGAVLKGKPKEVYEYRAPNSTPAPST